ncbi:MAG TPA: hypothetical protein VGC72_09140 [Candidatus Elarobacter sp.]|jgi:Flp pilus assembly pilin Flp
MTAFCRLLADDSGATLVEYALASTALALTAIAALAAITHQCATRLATTSGKLTALGTSPP